MDKELLEILACPKCKGDVKFEKGKIVCERCRLKFPVENGIPVMLVEEAEKF
ncbi:MAG: Trm112 family protein [Candidatus Micrarchaeota archaeon]|nr:Trm112 family protein [Candidatus Micrarchaeota archaeon]